MLRKLFYIGNFLLVIIFVAALALDNNREWKKYQTVYYQKEIEQLQTLLQEQKDPAVQADLKDQLRKWKHKPVEIKQILVKDLGRVDRCITCHVGMDEFTNPTLANNYKENPYKGHPDISGLIKKHPFMKFGCTECHGGQGMGTTVEAAHGAVENWDKPMLKSPYLQSSCAKCHENFDKIHGAEVAAAGRKLFEKNGCIGCHSIRGQGGIISVDLGEISDKPLERIDFSHTGFSKEKNEWTVKNWIEAHLTQDTIKIVPNDPHKKFNAEPISPSGMPPFYLELSKAEAASITTYLLSLTSENIPRQYYVYSPAVEPKFSNPTEHGKYVFQKMGCMACHGIGGAAGRRNYNAMGPNQKDPENDMDKGREPTLTKAVSVYTRDELRKKIQNGVPSSAIAKFNPNGPTPPLYMPSWRERIKGQDLEDLMTYLFSIAEKDESGF